LTQTFVIHLAREALFMVLLLAGPAMVAALLIGLLISVLQATTQIQDQMLSMVPKIRCVCGVAAAWRVAFEQRDCLYSQPLCPDSKRDSLTED